MDGWMDGSTDFYRSISERSEENLRKARERSTPSSYGNRMAMIERFTCNSILFPSDDFECSMLGLGMLLGLVRTLLLCSGWKSSSSCWFNKIFNILCLFWLSVSLLVLSWVSSLALPPLVNKFLSLPDSVDTTLFWVSTTVAVVWGGCATAGVPATEAGLVLPLFPSMTDWLAVVGQPAALLFPSSCLLGVNPGAAPFALTLLLAALLVNEEVDSWSGLREKELLKVWAALAEVGLNARRGLQWGATAELEKVPWGLGDVGAGWEDGREFGGPLALDSGLSAHPLLLSKSQVELGNSSNSKSMFPEKWLNGLLVVVSDGRGLHDSAALNTIELEGVAPAVPACDDVPANPRLLIPLTWPFRCATADISGPPTLLLLLPLLLLLLFAQRLLECPEHTLLLESWPPSIGVKSLSLSWTRNKTTHVFNQLTINVLFFCLI